MHNLQVGKLAVGLQISEPWLREYQVLFGLLSMSSIVYTDIMSLYTYFQNYKRLMLMSFQITIYAGTSIKNPSMYADEWIRWVHSQRDQDMYQQLIDTIQ